MDFTLNLATGPAAVGSGASSDDGKEVASGEGAAALSTGGDRTWLCRDCGWKVKLITDTQLDEARDHWKVCNRPSEATLVQRQRGGLDPNVIPLSPSQLETFEACARQAWFTKQDPNRVRIAGGARTELGTAIHTYAETGDPTPPADLPLSEVENWPWMCRRIDWIHGQLGRRPHALFLEETVRWEYEQPDGRRVQMEGRIDRLYLYEDNSFLVIDYKTGEPSNLPDAESIDEDVKGRTYLVAVKRLLPFVTTGKFAQAQVRNGQLVEGKWKTAAEIDLMDQTLAAKAARYAAERTWSPTPGRHCSYCDFRFKCPMAAKWLGEGFKVSLLEGPMLLENHDDVWRAMQAVLVAKGAVEDIEKAIDAYVQKVTGKRVDFPDGGWYGEEQKMRQRIYDKQAAYQALLAAGYRDPLGEAFNFDHRNAKLFKLPDSPLANLVIEEKTSSLGYHKPTKAKTSKAKKETAA